MASTIQLKTGTGSAVPANLTQGELAINVDNGLIYYGSGSTNTTKKLESFTHITSSGDISASGTIITDKFKANLEAGVDNSVLIKDADGFIKTDEINSTVWELSQGALLTLEGEATAPALTAGLVAGASQPAITTTINLTTVGALNAGSITSGFTSIDVGAGAITTTGTLTGGAFVATGHTTLGNAITDKHTFTGHITASHNISSSGTITTKILSINDTIGFSGNSTGLQIGYTSDVPIQIGRNAGNRTTFTGNITSSGNISSSGTITANKIESDQLFSHVGDANTGIQLGSDSVQIEGNDVIIANFTTTQIQFNKPITTNITASGTISASGTIYGRQWEQIETNLTADIGSLSGNYDGDDFVFLPWTDTDAENTAIANKFVNRAAVAPGKPIKTAMRATSNTLGTTAYTMSLWENKTDQGNNNLILVTEACADSTGTNREVVTFDWTNPCSGSNVDITYGSRMWMGIKTTNGNATYAITHLWEWDYGSL
jgi:hypothetical protein